MAAPTNKFGLNPQQQKFCDEYLIDFDVIRAYRAAKYKAKKVDTAYASASEILSNPKCQAYIEQKLQERQEPEQLLVAQIINERKRVAFSRISDVLAFDDDGVTLADSSRLPSNVIATIERITHNTRTVKTKKGDIVTTTTKSVALHNKDAALKALERIFGLDTDLNAALASLRRYGVTSLKLKEDGGWEIEYSAV